MCHSLTVSLPSPLLQKSPQTESCTDSGAENEGSCHSDQMSNDFSTDDGVDEGICLDNAGSTERVLKPKVRLHSPTDAYATKCTVFGNGLSSPETPEYDS